MKGGSAAAGTAQPAPKKESRDDRIEFLAMELFVKLYSHPSPSTPEHLARESFQAAEAFFQVAKTRGE